MAAYKEMKKELKIAKNVSLFNGQLDKTPEEFSHIEIKLTEHEKTVVEMLKLVADGVWKMSEKHLNTIGDLYPAIRETVIKTEKDAQKHNKQEKKKSDQIREKNVLEKVRDSVVAIEKYIHQQLWKLIPSTSSDLIEHRLVMMIYHLIGMTKNVDHQTSERQYDLAFGCAKILSKLETLEVRHKQDGKLTSVNGQLINDFRKKYEEYLEQCDFDILYAASAHPKLFIRTSYDHILPGMSMAPYVSQLETIQTLKNNKKNGCLIWLNTLTGEGKTSLVVSIGKWALNIRTTKDKDLPNPEVIYCCHRKLKSIRQQVGQYAWNASLPFGIAEMKEDHTLSVTDHPSYCKKDCPRVLTIADIDATIELLRNREKNYILFFDEPTFTLDQPYSEMIHYLTDVFNIIPKWSIFSTATAPEKEKIPRLERIIKNKYPESIIHFITSMRVQIGSEISDFSGSVYLPHSGCTTRQEFENVIKKIEKSGFLQKCYTANVVNGMFSVLTHFNKKYGNKYPIVDFKTYMENPKHLNQHAIQTLGMMYLKNVLEISEQNDIVRTFCKVQYNKEKIDFTTLATSFGVFENQTLIVTENPTVFYDTYFTSYLSSITEKLGKTFADLYKEYLKNIDLFKNDVDQKMKDLEKTMKSKSAEEKERERYDKLQEYEVQRPRLSFPEKFVIGSKDYYENENREDKEDIKRRDYLPVEQIDLDSISCLDKYQLGLVVGIGILSKEMSSSYVKKVSEMSLKGLLAYVIADDDICYGTNYPFENVIVDECMISHSVKTIFQVFARAGRPGKSWKASIFAHHRVIDKLKDYVFDRNYIDIETNHMNDSLQSVECNDCVVIPEKRDKIEKKVIKVGVEKKVEKVEEKEEKVEKILKVELNEPIPDSWEDEI